jgi:ribonuclease PH
MRRDGRAANEMRPATIAPDYVEFAAGSALISMGKTKVLCTASVAESVPAWMAGRGRGWLTATYAMLPASTSQRTPRETSGVSGRSQEIQRLIGRALRAALNLDALGERTLFIDCDVLQADGGTRTAAVTGGYVALVLALRRLMEAGAVQPQVLGIPVAAVSVGLMDHAPCLDLNYEEDSRAETDLNVVMTGDGEFVEVQGTAEGRPFRREHLDELLDLARQGIEQLLALQEQALQ